jgi:hypothetical protein
MNKKYFCILFMILSIIAENNQTANQTITLKTTKDVINSMKFIEYMGIY